MKNFFKNLIAFVIIALISGNIILNFKLREIIKSFDPDIYASFALVLIPDRVTLFNVAGGNFHIWALTAAVNFNALLKKDFNRIVHSVSIYGLAVDFINYKDEDQQKHQQAISNSFAIPFCRYFKILWSRISYIDLENNTEFKITNINGNSTFTPGKIESEDTLAFNGQGWIFGNPNDKVFLKFYFYPYYKNKFFLNVFASKINARLFEPMFKSNNLKILDGMINFVVQIKGEMRKISVNNIMDFNNLKVREDVFIDPKAFLGLSVEQMVDFLKDSKGDFYVNFSFDIEDSEFLKIFEYYGDHFKASLVDRVKLGAITAPARQIKDLIWNLTGENIFRILNIFGIK